MEQELIEMYQDELRDNLTHEIIYYDDLLQRAFFKRKKILKKIEDVITYEETGFRELRGVIN